MIDEEKTRTAGGSAAARGDVGAVAVIGGVLLATTLLAVALVGKTKPVEFLAFVFLVAVAPPVAAVLAMVARATQGGERLLLVCRVALIAWLVGVLILGGIEFVRASSFQSSIPFLVVLAIGVGAAGLGSVFVRSWHDAVTAADILDVVLIALLILTTITFGALDPAARISELVAYYVDVPRVHWWLLFGAAFVGLAVWMWRTAENTWLGRAPVASAVALGLFTLFLVSLFDDRLRVNMEHYAVHVGPAMHSIHGGTALVDVFCIYGLLPWMVVKAAFVAIAPTYGAAAVVVRVSTLAYYLAMGVALFGVARYRWVALMLMVPMILVAATFHPGLYNLNALPSTSGLRYLVPALMVVVMTTVSSRVWSRWLATALLVISALWSLETFGFSLVTWGYVLFLEAIRTRSLRRPAGDLAVALCGVVLAHGLFALWTYVATGRVIDYGPYLGMVANFRPYSAAFWTVGIDPNFAAWVPVWLGLFLVLAVAVFRAIQRGKGNDVATRLAPVAAFGFATLSYFSGFPRWSSLGLAFLPLAVVLICSLEALALRWRDYGRSGLAALVTLGAVAALLVAFGTERFARPVQDDQGNSSVLRRCLEPGGCDLVEVARALGRRIYAAPLDPDGPVHWSLVDDHMGAAEYQAEMAAGFDRVRELVAVLRERAPNAEKVVILADTDTKPHAGYVGIAAFMQTGQWFRFGISSPMNDQISLGVRELILDRAARDPIADGELLVVAHDRGGSTLMWIEAQILAILERRCRLTPLETRKYFSVLRMDGCSPIARN